MKQMKYTIYWGITLILLLSCTKEKNKQLTVDEIIATKDIKSLQKRQQELEIQYAQISTDLDKINTSIEHLAGTRRLPLVTSYTVKDTFFQHEISIQGSVDTRQNTMLTAEFSGTLKHLYIKEGQRVNKGQLLATIDDSGISQQLAQVQVQYQLAKTTFERQERLWNRKIGSEIQYLQAKTQKEALESNIKQIKAQLSKTEIRAPYSGTIDDIPVKQGAMIIGGQTPVTRLINLSNMYVRANVSEVYLGKIKKGTSVQLHFPAINKEMSGKIKQTGNFINPNNRTFYIEVDVPGNSSLIKPNLMAILRISDYINPKAITVPANVIQEDATGKSYLFVVIHQNNKNIIKKRSVTKGLTQGHYTEILSGLKSGEQIINDGSGNLLDNMEVDIKQ